MSTKIHAVVSERGELVRYVLTGGQVNDSTQATTLVSEAGARAVVGDRGYDSDAVVAHVEALGMAAVIPSRRHRKAPRHLDVVTYGLRNVIERYFGRVKVYRRIATRYDKTACSFVGFFAMGSLLAMLTGWWV